MLGPREIFSVAFAIRCSREHFPEAAHEEVETINKHAARDQSLLSSRKGSYCVLFSLVLGMKFIKCCCMITQLRRCGQDIEGYTGEIVDRYKIVKPNLFWGIWEIYLTRDGESKGSYYSRCYKLMECVDKESTCKFHNESECSISSKNFNHEWSRFVKVVKQSLRNRTTVSYHKLFESLEPITTLSGTKHHKTNEPSYTAISSTRPSALPDTKVKRSTNQLLSNLRSVSEEDSDPEQPRRDKGFGPLCHGNAGSQGVKEYAYHKEKHDDDEEIDDTELEAHEGQSNALCIFVADKFLGFITSKAPQYTSFSVGQFCDADSEASFLKVKRFQIMTTMTPCPQDKNVVPSAEKQDSASKAKVVMDEQEGDEDQTVICSLEAVRIFVARSTQVLFHIYQYGRENGAFLSGPLKEEVFVAQRRVRYPDHPEKSILLRKASVRLKQAPRDLHFQTLDHAGCLDTRKSTSGGIQFLGDKLVSWMSKKQNCTAMSSAEAEYVALSASCAQVMWMRTQLQDYGFNYNKIPLYCDSQSAIAISCNPYNIQDKMHILTRLTFIRNRWLGMIGDECMWDMPTQIELTTGTITTIGVSNDVLVCIEGVEE
ncbi:hypothetical protein Tco_0415126 [Tanacetum coccineum]